MRKCFFVFFVLALLAVLLSGCSTPEFSEPVQAQGAVPPPPTPTNPNPLVVEGTAALSLDNSCPVSRAGERVAVAILLDVVDGDVYDPPYTMSFVYFFITPLADGGLSIIRDYADGLAPEYGTIPPGEFFYNYSQKVEWEGRSFVLSLEGSFFSWDGLCIHPSQNPTLRGELVPDILWNAEHL